MRITSFGFKYGGPNADARNLVLDVRPLFQRNPYRRRDLRYKRGDDPEVIADILRTPGFAASYAKLKARVAKASPAVERVWLGCTGGHHRSVMLANRLGAELGVAVDHRDYERR